MANFQFLQAKADAAIRFFEKELMFVEGLRSGSPFVLEPWQKKIIGDLFGWLRPDGTRRYRTAFIEVPRGNGKALALDTPIPTPNGWTTMGEVQVGDFVFGQDGKPARVVAATDVMHNRPCYRVVFSDGESIVCDEGHLWETVPRRTYRLPPGCLKGKPRAEWSHLPKHQVFTTKRILETISVSEGKTEWSHKVENCAPLQLPEAELPIDPYVLGAWLGDGDSANAAITCSGDDSEIIEHIASSGTKVTQKASGTSKANRYWMTRPEAYCSRGHYLPETASRSRKNNRCMVCERAVETARRRGEPVPEKTNLTIQELLRLLGVLNNKHIPAVYLRGSYAQRLALIQGMMDTDGYCAKNGQCEFTTTSEQLRDGFLEVIRSIGIKPGLMTRRAMLYGKDCGEKYRILFHCFADQPCFRLARKRARLKQRPATMRSGFRQIVAVEPVESVPVRCIQVDSPRNLYLSGRGLIPTHNSMMCAGLALYLLLRDGENRPQVYSAGGDRGQARIVFQAAREMVSASPHFEEECELRQYKIEARSGGWYEAISAEAHTKHGYAAHGIIFDELHVQPNRELWDVLTTSTGKRHQPLTVAITTAGHDRSSICWEMHQRAKAAMEDPDSDPYFYAAIWDAGHDEDWTDEAVWKKANPNLGISVKLEYLREMCEAAKANPELENTFRNLHLNQWTGQALRWIQMHLWDECQREFSEEDFYGKPCFAAIDLASTRDATAAALVFPRTDGTYTVLPYFWIPEKSQSDRAKQDRRQLLNWAAKGLVKTTPGNVAGYFEIADDLAELRRKFDIQHCAFDPWGPAQAFVQIATNQCGFDPFWFKEFRQTIGMFAAPSKEFMRLIASQKLHHDGNPVLRWMAENTAAKRDLNDNIRPDKENSADKIDGIVALIMALGLCMSEPQPYEFQPGSLGL